MKALILLLGLLGSTLCAQTFPQQHSVNDVADNDRLNVRAAPNAQSEIVDSYFAYKIDVEILSISDDGKWGQVPTPEGHGWVAMRYLTRNPDPADGSVPRPLNCFGTEPFWSIANAPRGSDYRDLATDTQAQLDILYELHLPDGYMIRYIPQGDLPHTLIATRALCGDGMSDRVAGLEALVIGGTGFQSYTLTGCCSLTSF